MIILSDISHTSNSKLLEISSLHVKLNPQVIVKPEKSKMCAFEC